MIFPHSWLAAIKSNRKFLSKRLSKFPNIQTLAGFWVLSVKCLQSDMSVLCPHNHRDTKMVLLVMDQSNNIWEGTNKNIFFT